MKPYERAKSTPILRRSSIHKSPKYEIPKKLREKFGKNARMNTSKEIMVIMMKP
jgi:hypothetical protein